jgi:PAS domain S-box-containing protein
VVKDAIEPDRGVSPDGSVGVARGPLVERSRLLSYGLVLPAVALAAMVRYLIEPDAAPFTTRMSFLLAVMLVSYYGGRGPGWATIAASVLTIWYFFTGPRFSFEIAATGDAGTLVEFAFVGTIINLLIARLHNELTEARRREQVLERQMQMIELSHEAIITLDPNRLIQSWNRGATAMYGWTREEAIGRGVDEMLHTEWSLPLNETLRILERDGYWEGELTRTTRDGRKIVIDSRLILVRDAAGQTCGTLVVSRDITDRKKTESALRESQAKLRSALESATDAIFISDAEGRLVDFNNAFATFYHFPNKVAVVTRAVELSQFVEARFPDGTIAPVEMWSIPRALRGERVVDAEYHLRRKDTGESWIGEYSFGPIRDGAGTVVGAVVVARDVTARKQAERALLESEQRFRTIFETAPIGVGIADGEGRLVQCNPALCAMLGYGESELNGSWFGAIVAPEDLEAEVASAARFRVERMRIHHSDLRCLRKDGERIWVHRVASLLEDGNGGVDHVMALLVDITERKRAEEEIRRLNATLERRIEERTAQLKESNRELEAFSYSISHDLRAPLRGIDGWSLAVLEDYGELFNADARAMFERVRAEAQRMGQLIDDLLELSRVTRREMRLEPVDLTGLAETVARRLKELNPGRNIEVMVEPGLAAHGDARLLEAVFTNLLSNAVKFTAPREVARIAVGRLQQGRQTVFFVRDNGVGFDMTYAGRMFGAFQRLHSAAAFPGSGIGLAIVERLVHRHGGSVWAEAEVNGGATFYFNLAAETDARRSAAAAGGRASTGQDSGRIS